MMSEETQYFGRTSLRRHLSYSKYILAFRLTMGFFILVQAIPFLMVSISSIQSGLWAYAVASFFLIALLVAWAVLAEENHIEPLRGCFLQINGQQVTGRMNRKDFAFSFSDIDTYELSKTAILGRLFHLVLKDGTRCSIKFGLERFDYLIDSLMGYRPDFRTQELLDFRQEVLVNDHLLSHFYYYTRKWGLLAYQFGLLPLLLLLYVKQQHLMSKFGIMENMSVATIVILNLGFGIISCLGITLLLHWRTVRLLRLNPANTRRDLKFEAKMDYLGLVVHTLLMVISLSVVVMV